MKTPKYFALKSVGHFLPGMAINVELDEERVETLTKHGFITTEKPDTIVVNEEKSALAAKGSKAKSKAAQDAGDDEPTDNNESDSGDEPGDVEDVLKEARAKLASNKRLTIAEVKTVLDDEFIEYDADANHGELMKLIPVNE